MTFIDIPAGGGDIGTIPFPAWLIPGSPLFSWPHVSVASLTKTF